MPTNALWNDDVNLFFIKSKIYIPNSLRKEWLLNLHGYIHSEHPTFKKAWNNYKSSNFYWPEAEADLQNHIAECHSCQKTAPAPKVLVPASGKLFSSRPFESIHVDTMGPLPEDNDGMKYIFVFVDAFSRFTILHGSKTNSANDVAYAIIQSVIANFGIPYHVHSDNGSEYSNAVLKELFGLLNITNSFSVPHHHQSNGLVERRNREVNKNLRKFIYDLNDFQLWSAHLPTIQLLLNSKTHSVTKFSPYEILFGLSTDPRKSSADLLELLSIKKSAAPLIRDLIARTRLLKEKWEKAKNHQRQSTSPAAVSSTPQFDVHSYVLRYNENPGRLHGKWLGPYKVISSQPNSSTLTLLNLVTKVQTSSSVYLCKPFVTSSVDPDYFMCSTTVPDAVEGRHMMVEDSRLSSPQTSHQPSGPVSNRASGATFQTSTQMMRQFDKDCEGLSREEQVQLFWDRKDAFMEAHEQQQKYIAELEAEIKESTDEQLRLQLERDALVALIEDEIEDQEFHDHLRGNGLFIDEDGHMCQLPSTDSDDEFRIFMTDVPDHIDLTIGASYRLFPHLIRDTAEFLKITNSASTSAIISVSSADEDDLYEQFLGQSPKDTRLFDNLGNELPGPWNPPININIKPRTDIPLAPPNFDHVGIHDNAGYYSPCIDPVHPDEGPFDIMIATLDDSRAVESEIDEDNLFAERLTIDPLSHNPLSSSDSDLPEDSSWTQIPDPNHVFNDWLKLLSQEQEHATKNNDITMTTDTELITMTANDKDYVLTWNHRKKKFVIPDSLKRHLLLTIHGSTRAGHPSKKDSVSALLRSDYWWPNYLYDMKFHVKNCIPCQKTAPAPELKLPSSGNLWSDRPFQCLHADVIGPLAPDSEDYKYILVFVCSFSRFSILVPLKILNAQEVAYSILWNVVGNYGIPSQILSDNGPEFANAVNKSLCLFLNIEKKFSTPYFHQSNGLVERRHREVLQTLRRLLIDLQAHSNWSTYIPITQLILNTRTSSITNFTPFELIFGSKTDPRQLPLQVIQNCTLDDHLPQNSYVDALKQKTSTILNKWKEAENSSNLKKRSLSSRNSQGDFVLKLSEHPSKTHGKWTGPYLVEDVCYHPSNCLIRNLITGISVRCSLYHVKKCHTNHSENVLQAYAATDSEEVVIDKLIDHDLTSPQDTKYLVRWLDGTTTWEGRSVENTAAYYAYRRKYIDEPPQARGLATARANSKLDAAWKAQHHKSAPVVARYQHRMKTRNRTSH
ncbi:hypothetical protein GEMRC1_001252 [Eukaryota sp. GEM-RC1]